MSKISVVVPVYKVEPYLRRCVDSVLTQTHTDFELILVDDGSPDGCPAICDEYAAKDNRVHVIHKKNGGLSDARNAGIDWVFANSDSEWITFIDSDDWIHPQTLQQLYHACETTRTNVSVGGFYNTDGISKDFNPALTEVELWDPEQFYIQHNMEATVAWGKLYHRDCFSTLRYPVGKIHEDEFLTYRILFEQPQIAVMFAPFYAYFKNATSITSTETLEKKMHTMEALDERFRYFSDRGFEKAKANLLDSYIYFLSESYTNAKNSGQDLDKPYLYKNIQKKLRGLLKKSSYTVNTHAWMYEIAYPTEMRVYWLWKRFFKKS